MIRCKPQLTAWFEDTRELFQRTWLDEAALVMPELRPGIWEKDKHTLQTCAGQSLQHTPRIVHVDADIGQALGASLRQQLCNTILEGFASDEPRRRVQRGLRNKMLSPAKPHLKGKRRGPGEQQLGVKRPFRKVVMRRKISNKGPLMTTQRSPFPSAMKDAAPWPRPCQANMLLSCVTRSVRSQEKPPSASAARPK